MKPPPEQNGTPHRIHPIGWTAALLVLLMTAFWGGNAVATRFAIDVMPPIAAAAVRFGLASLFMLVWCYVEGSGLRLRSGQVTPAVILGLMMALQIGLFNIGVWLSNSSHAVMLVNTALFWVLGIEHFVTLSHRLTRRKSVGVLLASVGAALVLATSDATTGSADDPSLVGDLILLCSAFILGIKIVYTRHAVKVVEPGKLIFWHDTIGMVCFIGCSFLLNEQIALDRIDTAAVVALLYQGLLVGGFCFAMHAWLLQKHSASQISVFGFATPIFGVVAAWLLRSDPLSPWFIAAVVCVAGGIVLVNVRPSRAERESPDDETAEAKAAEAESITT